MTTMKKRFALLLAVLMLLSVVGFAGAEDTAEVTAIDGHTFTAYQIFTGSQASSEGALGNVQWGDGINDEAFLTALKAETSAFNVTITDENGGTTTENAFSNCEEAQDVADALTQFANNSDAAKKFAQLAYANKTENSTVVSEGDQNNLTKGYYLIVDTTDFGQDATDNAYNAALLQVTDNIVIAPKTSVPTVEKKVKDANDTTDDANATNDWQDSADYDIGDNVPYQLTAKLGNEISYYETYAINFVDTLSNGLTYNDDLTVKIDNTTVESNGYTATNENGVLTISIADVLALGAKANSVITVEYTATLNTSAVIGSAGNPNTVKLQYSNNPNTNGMGETKEDKVTVFTYQLTVEKQDGEKNPLAGAAFTLYKKGVDGNYTAIGDAVEATETTGESFKYIAAWNGLDDGDYKLVETQTPSGYNTIEPIEFTISATHDATSDSPTLTHLTGANDMAVMLNDGNLNAVIINKSGATLPETGGIGTTIFYVAGGVLVLLAVVLLVTKRRVGEEN